jgi:acetoin utilization deacetylase AcuC-like enzyme
VASVIVHSRATSSPRLFVGPMTVVLGGGYDDEARPAAAHHLLRGDEEDGAVGGDTRSGDGHAVSVAACTGRRSGADWRRCSTEERR